MKSVVKKFSRNETAFTIVELLTVMSIIIILTSLLVPGLHMAKKYAKKVKQNTQFYNVSQALELFNSEEDGYPPSQAMPVAGGGNATLGAHHLAEALMGRDLLGFDPVSSWDAAADATQLVYGPGSPASVERRKGPYLKLKNIGVFQVHELYAATGGLYSDGAVPAVTPSPLLTDVYTVKSVILDLPGGGRKVVKAGSPVLYYRASKMIDVTQPLLGIYDLTDNLGLIQLGKMTNQTIQHYFDPAYTNSLGQTGDQIFYEAITNPLVRPEARPYNQNSFILISAGYDGLYGTNDDVYNF